MNDFTQPSPGQYVTVPVPAHRFVVGMVVFHEYGGYYRITGTTPTSLSLTNLGVTSDIPWPMGYSNPASGTTIVHNGARIVPVGEPGKQGSAGVAGGRGVVGPDGKKGDKGDRGLDGYSQSRPFGTCKTVNSRIDGCNEGIPVVHALHGFVAGQVLRVSTNFETEFELASAATLGTSYAVGIVQYVIDENTFMLVTSGRVEFADELDMSGLPGWAPDGLFPGTLYYLSDTPGELSLTPGTISRVLMIGYEERTGFFNQFYTHP